MERSAGSARRERIVEAGRTVPAAPASEVNIRIYSPAQAFASPTGSMMALARARSMSFVSRINDDPSSLFLGANRPKTRADAELLLGSALRTMSIRRFAPLFAFLFAVFTLPQFAMAGPSASGSISSSSGANGKSSGFELPDLVYGGNAISAQLPLQFGIAGYLPKARFAFQYDRQLRRAHWVHVGAALIFDRGDWENFRQDSCGLTGSGVCGKGGVVGVDLYAGYTHKFFLAKRPWLVPMLRGSLGWSMFALPRVGGGDSNRLQDRTRSWTLNVRPGGGVRVFLFKEFGVGADINLPFGFLVHRRVPEGGSAESNGGVLFGIEVLPLVAEYRF